MTEKNINQYQFPDVCLCCGAPVPEGRMICGACEEGAFRELPLKENKETETHKHIFYKKEKRTDL